MAPLFILLLPGIVTVSTALDTTNLCRDLLFINCTTYQAADREEQVCAEGKTYRNFCEYSQAKCRYPNIEIQWIGSCRRFDSTTTPMTTQSVSHTTTMPTTTTLGSTTTLDPLIAVFCAHKDTIKCTSDIASICASDGFTYTNDCFFAKKRCDIPNLSIQPLSSCHSG